MHKLKRLKYWLSYNPRAAWVYIWTRIGIMLPDRLYLRVLFRIQMGYWMDFKHPKTYNEKLQWLKLHDKRPEYTQMVDKVEVKNIVANRIGEQYVIPTIGIWDRPEDIPWDQLPNQFVAKVTHDSGGIIICKDKKNFDIPKAIVELSAYLKRDFYSITRECPYKNVRRRVLVERYMEDESGYELKDYKFFCFDGEPKMLFIATDRLNPNEETKFDFYDMDFNLLPFTNGHEHAKTPHTKPKSFETMVKFARVLSAGIPHVRLDFYDIDGNIYFGEMTFFHWSGMMPFEPQEWDYKIGEWLTLPTRS